MKRYQSHQSFFSIFTLFMCILLVHCSQNSATQNQNAESLNSTPATNSLNLKSSQMEFSLNLLIDSQNDEYDFLLSLDETYSLPLQISDENEIAIQAKDFPKIIYRICDVGSSSAICDSYTDALGFDIDLVIDSCGKLKSHSECGQQDNSTYIGELKSNGEILIENISMRTRIIKVSATSDGYTASDADVGLFSLEKITVTLSTDSKELNGITFDGALYQNNKAKLIVSGQIPSSTPFLGGGEFVGEIDGQFSSDLLNLF